MADDIVERLRSAARSGDLPLGVAFDCDAVADEIERLRDELAAWQATVRAHDALAAERADEIERLRAAGDALVAFATHERGCFLPGLEQCWCGKSVAAARWREARQ